MFCTGSLWLRETCTEYDESLEVKQQHTIDTKPNGPGKVNGGGHGFETQVAALIGLRGLQRGDNFELLFNKNDAGNFCDLVYTAGGRRYFLQLKHADSLVKKKLAKEELVTLLQKCFKSYCDIKHGKEFRDIPVDKTEFIIYTNRKLDPKLSQHPRKQTRVEVFFKTCDKEIFNFIPGKTKQKDVYTLLEIAVVGRKDLHRSVVREMVSEFCSKVIMATSQKDKSQLDDEIRKEIEEYDACNAACEIYKAELLYFKTRVETCLENKKVCMTAEMFRNWLQKARIEDYAAVVTSLPKSYKQKLITTGIHFANSEISRLQANLSNKRTVHLRSNVPKLCSIMLLKCLPESKCIFVNLDSLQSVRRMLLDASFGGDWQWCVVFCDQKNLRIHISFLFSITKLMPSEKRLIILTPLSVQKIQGFSPIDHKFKFIHLSKESQKMVLEKQVHFQGRKLPVKRILHRHGLVKHALGANIISRLVTGETVKLGGRLCTNADCYMPRVLEREVWLQLDVLRNPDLYPDMFAVSGMEVKDLGVIVPAGETVQYIDQQNIHHTDFTEDTGSRFIVLSEADAEICFLELCKKHGERTLHWVQFKNGTLLWKKTQGDPDKLLTYIDTERTRLDLMCIEKYMRRGTCEVSEDAVWDLGERTVLVVAEPAMGKSSTTTQVAWITKERDPASWVVYINWNDHTRELKKMDAARFNFKFLVRFLCRAAFPDSENANFDKILLEQALQKSGNVTVLMDGFDEISRIHMHKATVILSQILKTKAERIWVTSRPVQRERLEKELSVAAFSMKKLSRQFKVQMLLELRVSKKNRNKEKCVASINEVVMLVNQSVNDRNFTESPLYIKMIATAYELDIVRWIRLGFSKLSQDINLFRLYEAHFERKLHSYLRGMWWVDVTDDSILGSHERLKESFFEKYEKCALVAILPSPILESLHNKTTEEEIQSYLFKVQAGKYQTDVVMNVVNGKPQFVNPTLAEYFTACWFSRNFKFNITVMERVLFDREYSCLSDMFDRMLAKDCPLHCAVLDCDKELFESLLETSHLTAVDKGGRTVMHIIATRDCSLLDIINRVLPDEASLHITDTVLQWTPLQYAIKSENWLNVERLLESNIDRSGLDMIRQRAQDPDYIDPIIIESAELGLVLLFEFLYSIGVNIHQASSRCFPSALHAAIQGEQLQVIRWLIQHGADCNTRYSDGKTPLFHAVTKGSLDVVRALVEEGGASVDVRDDEDRTVIDWMNDYASDPKNVDDIVWKGDVERLNEIVKYLQKRGVESSAGYW